MGVSRMRYYDVKFTELLEAEEYASTQTSAAFDTTGWESLTVLFVVGLWTTDETVDFKLTECATDDGSFTDVASTDYVSSAVQVKDASTDQTTYMIAYTGDKQYIKAVGTHTGSALGHKVLYGVYALQSWPRATSGDNSDIV